MNYEMRGVSIEELSYKINRVQISPNQRLDVKPQFARQVRKVNEDKKISLISLSVKIESTEAEPKPFDLTVSVVGVCAVEKDDYTADEERNFVIDATKQLYPYLRSAVTNLTAQAYVMPLVLPVINGPMFPDDRDVYTFTPGSVS